MIDFPGLDHLTQPRTLRRALLHGLQEREEPRLVARPRILPQRLTERQMLRATLCRQLRRVGRDEREWRLFVGTVLGKVEVYAADEVPGGIAGPQKFLQRRFLVRAFLTECHIDLGPKIGEHLGGQILATRHRRCRIDERRQRICRRRRHLAHVRSAIRGQSVHRRAQHRDVPRSEIAPVGKFRRQSGADLAQPKFEQPVSNAACKRGLEAS